jgi:cytochrome b6-f complex iron-sulfur subunit
MSTNTPLPADNLEPLNRRTFVGAAMGGMGVCYFAAVGYPVYRYLSAPVERAEASAAITDVALHKDQLPPPGAALMFKFGPFTSILIHHTDGSWSAFDAKCTHLGCTVKFETDKKRIYCECHGGVYDSKDGRNIAGPPPKPLKRYDVKTTEVGVVVSKVKA